MSGAFQTIRDLFVQSWLVFQDRFLDFLPDLIAALLVLGVGWLLARFLSRMITKLLNFFKFDQLLDKLKFTKILSSSNVNYLPSVIIGQVFYWIIFGAVIITAAETMGWTVINYEVSKLLDFLPNLLTAIVFFILGTYVAAFVRDFIKGATSSLGMSTGKFISNLIFYLLFVIIALTALKQAGLDTSIITTNLVIIIGSIMLAVSISYGFASRDLLANILAGFFSRRIYRKGQIIEVDGVRGTIVDINNMAVIIQISDTERMVIPTSHVMNSKVKIIKQTT
jgi:small-conductance mechanosensitive channel